jgi:ElaB/YqjD/DUF883 family membrane-anchored ribosome-binding protein
MRHDEESRRPEEIEDDIERTRAEVSSTIDAIQSKLTPGQLMDQAVEYFRHSGPADFGANLGNTVRDNPMPVALIGVGLAWLMMSGQRSGDHYRSRYAARPYEGYESDWAARDAAFDEDGTYGDMKERAGETARSLKDKASELGHRMSEGVSSAGAQARETVQQYRERMGASAGGARARIDDLSLRSQQQYHRARDNMSHMIDEQPLVLGAIGIAIGAALGAALPSTRQEDEWMGRTRDDLVEGAKSTAREQADTVKGAARRVAETAEKEVEAMASETARRGQQGNGQTNRPSASGGAPGAAGSAGAPGSGSGSPSASGTPGSGPSGTSGASGSGGSGGSGGPR